MREPSVRVASILASGRVLRHNNRGLRADVFRGNRRGYRVIPRGERHDSVLPVVSVRAKESRLDAPRILKSAAPLEIFAFEEHLKPGALVDTPGRHHGSAAGERFDSFGRLTN